MSTLGRELARLRGKAGLTQDQVARAIGHSAPGKVSLWESDDRRPGRTNLAKLAKVLKTTVTHLQAFGGAYDPTAPRTTRRQRAAIHAAAGPSDTMGGEPLTLEAEGRRMIMRRVWAELTEEQQEQLLDTAYDMRRANRAAQKRGAG